MYIFFSAALLLYITRHCYDDKYYHSDKKKCVRNYLSEEISFRLMVPKMSVHNPWLRWFWNWSMLRQVINYKRRKYRGMLFTFYIQKAEYEYDMGTEVKIQPLRFILCELLAIRAAKYVSRISQNGTINWGQMFYIWACGGTLMFKPQ